MKKDQLIEKWLEMSSEDIVKTCTELGIETTDRPATNIKALISHLDDFEKNS